MKKLISIFMSVAMLLTITTGLTFTASADTLKSGDYTYELLADGTAQITKYEGAQANIEIPSVIDGKTVTSIGNSAFEDNRTLTEVTVPDSVKSIGDRAFFYCFGLKKITVSDKVEYIGTNAFGNTADEWYIDYSHNIDEPDLYYGGTALQWAKLVDGKTSLGRGFYILHCAKASKLDNFKIRLQGNKEIVIYGYYGDASNVVIPSKVEDYKVTAIVGSAFSSKNKTVKKITIGSNVKKIDPAAFNLCSTLESIVVSKSNNYFSSSNGVLYNKKKTKLIAFPSAKKCSSYKIPATVKAISEYAFYNSCGLKAITVSKDNKYFSASNGVLFNKKKTVLVACPSGKTSKSYTVPKSVKTIDSFAFVNCNYLQTVKLSKQVTSIELNGFYNCKKIKNVYYGGSKSDWKKIGYHYVDDNGKTKKVKYTSLATELNNAKIYYNAKV
ncbi:MAG: leucine-rich repeat domain-containing protein [Eubacterium sp.]